MAFFRLLFGLLKGAILGGAVGYGAYAVGFGASMQWVLFGLVGVLVGLLVGRPFWSHLRDKGSTVWVSILKAIVGFGVGAGLGALAGWLHIPLEVPLMGEERAVLDWPFIAAGAVGALYGAWVEVDDSPAKAKKKAEGQGGGKSAGIQGVPDPKDIEIPKG